MHYSDFGAKSINDINIYNKKKNVQFNSHFKKTKKSMRFNSHFVRIKKNLTKCMQI